jgi:integrase
VRVAESVYQRVDRESGKPVAGKYEFTYRDATGRQVWQTSKGDTKADAKAERAELLARMHRGERVERTSITVGEVARLWLERGTGQKGRWAPSTLEGYERIVRRHIERSTDPSQKPLATVKLRELSIDRVARWSQANERALAPTTAVIALVTLNQVCRYAVRRGWLAGNPVGKLEAAEKPHWTPKQAAILEPGQLAQLLDHASAGYRPLFEFLAYTGLRIGEALGLTWADIDHEAGLIRVHRQLSRHREHAPLKTEAGKREVILAPALAKGLRERWLASRYKTPRDFVLCNTLGRGLDYRDVGEAFRQAVKRAGLQAPGKLTLHSLRHGFASLLIANGLNVVYVSRQLGPREPKHHPGGLCAPVPTRRPCRDRKGRAGCELRGDGKRPLIRKRPSRREAPSLLCLIVRRPLRQRDHDRLTE